jgi:enamine deaminase RidA (YjgF/YER057c/UK114 family)
MATSTGDRTVVWPEGVAHRADLPYSPAIKAGGLVFVSGQLATDFETGIAPEAATDPESPYRQNALELQDRVVLRNLGRILEAAGCDVERDILRIYWWLSASGQSLEDFAQGRLRPRSPEHVHHRVRDDEIAEPRPATSGIAVRDLSVRGAVVGCDLIAVEPRAGIIPQGCEAPEGVASPPDRPGTVTLIRNGDWISTTAVASDFRGDWMRKRHMGKPSLVAPAARPNPYIWYGSEIEEQVEFILRERQLVAEAAGTSLERCVKAEVYLGHPSDFEGMDYVWRRWFPENPPARVVVPYSGLCCDGYRTEIGLTFLAGDADVEVETIETSDAPEPFGHEPQAVRAGEFLFFSTQMAVDSNGRLAASVRGHPAFPYYDQPVKEQMEYVIGNVAAICEAAGTSLEQLCRRQAFFDDLAWLAPTNEVWGAAFPKDPPASVDIGLGAGWPLLVPGVKVVLDLIGYAPALATP